MPLMRAICIFVVFSAGAFPSPLAWTADRRLSAEIPTPPPRPKELAPRQPAETTAPVATPAPDAACTRAMTAGRLVAVLTEPVRGQDQCGIVSPLKLEAIVLTDGARVPLESQPLLRCELAEAIGDWVREDIAPLARTVGGGLSKIYGGGGYECRGRNRASGASASEHSTGNAFDLSGFGLRDGRTLSIERANEALDFMTQIRNSACARFTTVLGPGSDGYHEAHIHVDLKVRKSGYRICQWDLE